jgi:hypothetical protein
MIPGVVTTTQVFQKYSCRSIYENKITKLNPDNVVTTYQCCNYVSAL